MKLLSINYLATNAKNSFLRFPLSILSSLLGSITGIYLIENKDVIDNLYPLLNLMLCFALGIPLFFCITIFSNKEKLGKKISLMLYALASLMLILMFFSFPDSQSAQKTTMPYIKYAIYNVSIHLLVSFIPYLWNKKLNGFWNYNKILFVRFWSSVLYSKFLYVGLCIALLAVDQLFNIHIREKLYLEILIIVCGFFNTWFFVAGIPDNFEELDEISEYPKGLKIFTQYILLPLLILYLIILYIYGGKILFLWSWPNGIVSYLIIIVSFIGILTFLLLFPYSNSEENGWIKKISKAYYFVLLPLISILFIAIIMRENDYGMTVSRYLVIMLGVWLTAVCIYFIIGRTNIKFIPISLSIMLIAISFGPWGMFSVSERSQVARLDRILEDAKILQSGKINKEAILKRDTLESYFFESEKTNEGILSDSLHNEVLSILNYLDKNHGFSAIKSWYKQDIDSIFKVYSVNQEEWGYYNEPELYMQAMGLKYEYVDDEIENAYFSYTAESTNVTQIKDYDYLISFSQNGSDELEGISPTSFSIEDIDYKMVYSFYPSDTLWIKTPEMKLSMGLNEMINSLYKKFGKEDTIIPESKMLIYHTTEKMNVKFQISSLEFENEKDTMKVTSISGDLFIKMK